MSLPYFSVVEHTIMLSFIEKVLCCFESCFSSKAAFQWFVTITIELMLRSDKLGVTSVIRDLALSPQCYDSMLHFFRVSSCSLEEIRKRWFSVSRGWKDASVSGASHVMQMVEDAYHAACTFGDSLLPLDRYFLTVSALEKLNLLNSSGDVHIEIVTKVKKSCTAFEKPKPRKPGRGWPPYAPTLGKLTKLLSGNLTFFNKSIFRSF